MPTAKPTAKQLAKALCLNCALCCNGVLFKDVVLRDPDDPERLQAAGLPLKQGGPRVTSATACAGKELTLARLPQPCAALESDHRCRVYAHRPSRCHDFECALFQAARSGALEIETALRLIGRARRRAERVRRLLRSLGETREDAPLSVRFRRLARKLEPGTADPETAHRFSQLSLAMHELNVILSRSFYP